MSAPSKRSRSMTNAFDQIISSAGTSWTGTPSTSASTACVEPAVVDLGDAVAGAEDEVDEVLAAARLAQPVREGQLGAVAGGLEQRSRARSRSSRPEEEVEVLGVAGDAGVALRGEGAADQERHVGASSSDRIA